MDVKTLSLEELQAAIEENRTALAALLENEELSDEQIAEAEAHDVLIDAAEGEIKEREEAAAKKAATVASLRDKVAAASEAPEDETPEDETPEEPEADEPEEPEVDETTEEPEEAPVDEVKASTVKTLAAKTARPQVPEASKPKVVTITAAADVPDFSTGQALDGMEQVGSALVSRMSAFGVPSGDGRSENLQHYGVAKFKIDFPEELTVKGTGGDEAMQVLHYAANESRLESEQGKGSLVAAGGWCAPSETLYDLCVTGESLDGILSIPEVNIARGGINFTKGPDFAAIYSNVGFLQTEAEAIAGETKACFEVPCPPFSEVRLDAIGLCIKAPILTNAAYPELVQRWLSGSMVAHAHKVNASVISRIDTLVGAAETVTDFSSTTHTTLSALELLANYKRQTYKLGLNESLEVILPYWVKSAIRDDMSLRAGISHEAVTDAMIASHFAARNLNVQFVYDWQELDTSNATEGYPTTYNAILYPAGSFIKGTSDVITLNAVYDAASLAVNVYTALFFEQGLLVANICADGDKVALPVCNSGHMGIADTDVCGTVVA